MVGVEKVHVTWVITIDFFNQPFVKYFVSQSLRLTSSSMWSVHDSMQTKVLQQQEIFEVRSM